MQLEDLRTSFTQGPVAKKDPATGDIVGYFPSFTSYDSPIKRENIGRGGGDGKRCWVQYTFLDSPST